MNSQIRSNYWVSLSIAVLLWLLSLSGFYWGCKTEAVSNQSVIEEGTESIRDPRIPSLAYGLKRAVRAEVNYYWGLEQRGTVFYSQIHQESSWNPDAKSQYASGLAQFTPDTAKWIASLYPADLGENNPLDARWAIRACVRYDRWLYDRSSFAFNDDHRWRFSLSGYNGGAGWVSRDRSLAETKGKDSTRWICNVEHFSNRATWAIKENRDYVTKILDRWSPMYEKAGFI